MLGELYEDALTGLARPEIEYEDGRRAPLRIDDWLHAIPGDSSILDRCQGHTLDVGSGPGRLTVALAERGVPALGIDITPSAVQLARSCGALALHRDVFATVPGTGRWARVLLADGNIGIGGDPDALLSRVAELLKPLGQALVEVEPPGAPLAKDMVRLSHAGKCSSWFPWASIGADQISELGLRAGLAVTEVWTDAGAGSPRCPGGLIRDHEAPDGRRGGGRGRAHRADRPHGALGAVRADRHAPGGARPLGPLRRRRLAGAAAARPPGGSPDHRRRDRHPAGGAVRRTPGQRRPLPLHLGRPGPGRGHRPVQYAPAAPQLASLRDPSCGRRTPRIASPPAAAGRLDRARGPRLHQDQPSHRAHHLPAGGRGLLPGVHYSRRRGGSTPIQAARRSARSCSLCCCYTACRRWARTAGWRCCGRGAPRWPWRRATTGTWTCSRRASPPRH